MNDNEPLKVGDRVRLRQFPHIDGTIWDVIPRKNMVIIDWSNSEDNAYVTDPQRWLEKVQKT